MLSLSLWLPLCFFSLSHTPSIPDHAAFPLTLIAQRGRLLPLSLLNLAFFQVSIRSSAVNGDMATLRRASLSLHGQGLSGACP